MKGRRKMTDSKRGLPLLMSLLALSWVVPLPVLRAQEAPPAEILAYADIVLFNGLVLTADDQFTQAEAVAVRDGKFLAAGTTAQILRMAGPKTRKLDLKGKTVVPGFIDTHQHLHEYAYRDGLPSRPSVNFKTLEQGLKELKAIADSTPPGKWIAVEARGAAPFSLRYGAKALTAKMLDAVAPNNPLSVNYDVLAYSVNSLVVKAIPPGTAGIVRDDTGAPAGFLESKAAGIVHFELEPWVPIEETMPLLKKEIARQNTGGITTLATYTSGSTITALKEMWSRGELTMRWRIESELAKRNPNLEAYLKRVGNIEGFGTPDRMLTIAGFGFSAVDHFFGGGGGLTSKPKIRSLPGAVVGPNGIAQWEEEDRGERDNVVLAIKYGWSSLGIHSVGDLGNTQVLAAYEEGLKNRLYAPKGQRLGIDHGPMITPEHIKKMQEMKIVIPSVGMKFIFGGDERVAYQYGADAQNGMMLTKSMVDAGIKPAMEADDASEPFFRPMWQIQAAVTRTDVKGKKWGVSPTSDERITRQQALWMYTNWAARYTGDEGMLGTIEPGKLADFVVLDGNYMTISEDELATMKVLVSAIGGRVIFVSPEFTANSGDLQSHVQ
jgi:predicted amidohydrolase YtcJ